ncbi:monocarboxylate transporter 13 isoform X1 [Nilaparvata lugens]|uniref:monocarboxylate transporter 13 isoform X2 n=1 Tax=Nilaparvata lugens TaxID=108931 RepID=UPI000B98E836|nr:monocarboxylate transporter 13 isoform X2 [Nilaparvata lugens]XP_039288206.1 monocarboxylate transporter 13 isoform X1 [Nilaparvata lugens]
MTKCQCESNTSAQSGPPAKTSNQKVAIAECEGRDEEYEYVPPDGGWGWLVLGGTVLINLLIPGTIKSFGVLFIEFLEIFNASAVAASWIPALCYFLYCSLGPLASYLSGKLGYRTVTLIGGTCAGLGMILSFFANSITYLYVSYGILVGTGAGLSFPPGIFIVTSYFVKLRGLANGIAISGSALGSIILPPFLRFLLETYGYRGAVLIMGGLTLNVWVGAMLYEPVQYHLKKVRKQQPQLDADDQLNKNLELEDNAFPDVVILDTVGVDEVDAKILDSPESLVLGDTFKDVNQPLLNVESCNQLNRKISPTSNLGKSVFSIGSTGHLTRKIGSCSTIGGRPGMIVGSTGQISRKPSIISRQMPRVGSATQMSRKISVISNVSTSSFRYVSTAFHGSTLVGLNPEFSSQLTIKSVAKPFDCCVCCSDKRSTKTVSQTTINKTDPNSLSSLLRDPVFLIILVSNASNAIGYTNFTILLPAYAVSMGFDKSKASLLLSVVAVFDLIGRVGGSALSDWLPIDKKVYFVGGLLVSGLSLSVLPFANSYQGISVFCGIFGLASGTYVGITAVIIVDSLGEDRLASSYGISLFVNGVLQLIGPPLCGAAYEKMGSYNYIFSALGCSLIIGASVWGLLPFVKKDTKK